LNSFRDSYKAMVNKTSTAKNINFQPNKENKKINGYWKPLVIVVTCLVMLFTLNIQNQKYDFVYLPLVDDVETEYSGGKEINLLGISDNNVYYALTTRSTTENITEIYKYFTESGKTEMIYQLKSGFILLVDEEIIYVNQDQPNEIEILNTRDLVKSDLYKFDQDDLIKSVYYQDHYLFIVYEHHDQSFFTSYDLQTKEIAYKKDLTEFIYPIAYGDGSLLSLTDKNEVVVLNMSDDRITLPSKAFNEMIREAINADALQMLIANEKIYFVDDNAESSLWYYDLITEQLGKQTTLSRNKGFSEKLYHDKAHDKIYIALQEDQINKVYCFDMLTNVTELIAEFEYGRVWDMYVIGNSYVFSVDEGIIVGNIR